MYSTKKPFGLKILTCVEVCRLKFVHIMMPRGRVRLQWGSYFLDRNTLKKNYFFKSKTICLENL